VTAAPARQAGGLLLEHGGLDVGHHDRHALGDEALLSASPMPDAP
jgi:hypothetical protein